MQSFIRLLLICFVFTALAATSAWAQDPEMPDDSAFTGWRTTLVTDLTLSQAAYSESWVGGERSSVAWIANINGSAQRWLAPWLVFRSTLRLAYGQTLRQDTANNWEKPLKSTDLIDWENIGVVPIKIHVNPYLAFRLESQFLDASFDPVNRYFSPVRLTESAGLLHRFYSNDEQFVQSRLGLALRQVFKSGLVFDQSDSSEWHTEDSATNDGGIEWVSDVKLDISERLSYTGKLTVFKAFFFSDSDKLKGTEAENYWKATDVNWENQFYAGISKIITVNLYIQLLYDKQVSKKGRFKETLGLGFIFKLL